MDVAARKRCGCCTLTKDISRFRARGRSGLQAWCSLCQDMHYRLRYIAERKSYAATTKRGARRHKLHLIALKSGPCVDCGGSFAPCQMDFDHLPGMPKLFNVAEAGGPIKASSEAAKCDLVCANCHRLRTWKRQNGVASAWPKV